MERLAVIDMGSNSFRLVVYGYERGGWWSLTDEIREATRVGAGMGDELLLKPEPIDRAVHTAAVFASFCETSGIDDVIAVATSAIRDARNRDELLTAIRDRTGLEPRVISGREEAWYGYLAMVNSTTLGDGFGIDMGGGSVQVMRMTDRLLERSESVRLGAVRVSEAFLPGEEAPAKAIKALRRHVAETLDAFGWWGATEVPHLVGIGGTIRNLAAAAQKRMELPNVGVQGFVIARDALEELIEELAARPASKRGAVPGIKPDRGDVILGGALVLAASMEHGGFDGVEVTEAGLREGIFFERLLEDRRPPLFEDVRRASVHNLASRFHPQPDHVRHVAALSLQIYDGLVAAGLWGGSDADRELLWAACMLHDVGVAIDYDDHHRHSHYLILSAGLPGFRPREVVLIALIARYHRKGEPDASELGSLAEKGDERRLRLLCGVIRLAEQLERSRDQSVGAVRLHADGDHVRLEAEIRAREGDPSVAIWSARRNADLLQRAIGKPVEVLG
jgi:exopolyphosphatase/guanosine-5'-triphosphate,3'-diphosphate pyrophosphatase